MKDQNYYKKHWKKKKLQNFSMLSIILIKVDEGSKFFQDATKEETCWTLLNGIADIGDLKGIVYLF